MVTSGPSSRDRSPHHSSSQRRSDLEFIVTCVINAPPNDVYAAWTRTDLFQQWWVPKSLGLTLLSCELDVRVGGTYRLTFRHPAVEQPMSFHGQYLEVVPSKKLVWTNEEAGGAGQVTSLTLEAEGEATRIVLLDEYPTKTALDDAICSGSACDMSETFHQLNNLLSSISAAS